MYPLKVGLGFLKCKQKPRGTECCFLSKQRSLKEQIRLPKKIYWNLSSHIKYGRLLYEFSFVGCASLIYWGCLCENWKPSFLPLLIFNWRTFSRRATACWWRQWVKDQVLTNQNSSNRWSQIVRQTICINAIMDYRKFFGKDIKPLAGKFLIWNWPGKNI